MAQNTDEAQPNPRQSRPWANVLHEARIAALQAVLLMISFVAMITAVMAIVAAGQW